MGSSPKARAPPSHQGHASAARPPAGLPGALQRPGSVLHSPAGPAAKLALPAAIPAEPLLDEEQRREASAASARDDPGAPPADPTANGEQRGERRLSNSASGRRSSAQLPPSTAPAGYGGKAGAGSVISTTGSLLPLMSPQQSMDAAYHSRHSSIHHHDSLATLERAVPLPWYKRDLVAVKEMLSTWLSLLIVAAPLGIASAHLGWGAIPTFCLVGPLPPAPAAAEWSSVALQSMRPAPWLPLGSHASSPLTDTPLLQLVRSRGVAPGDPLPHALPPPPRRTSWPSCPWP